MAKAKTKTTTTKKATTKPAGPKKADKPVVDKAARAEEVKARRRLTDVQLKKGIAKFCQDNDGGSYWGCIRWLREDKKVAIGHARFERLWNEVE